MRIVLLSAILLLLSLGACKTPAGSAMRTKPENRTKTEKQDKQEKKEPPQVIVSDDPTKDLPEKEDKKPEINTNQTIPGIRTPAKKNTINIAVLIPMDGKYKYSRFATFIDGMTQAAKNSLGSPIVNINVVNVAQETNAAIIGDYPAVKNADILVGGFITSQVRALGDLAALKQIPLISPWNTTDMITNNNPYFIQLKPSMQSYCYAIADYVSTNINPEKILIIIKSRSSKDYTTVPNYQSFFNKKNQSVSIFISDEVNENDWKNLISNNNSVVIIPNWEDKDFIFQTLSKVRAAKKNASLVTIGMPQWADFDQVDLGLYETLNTIIPTANYFDPTRIDVKIFKESYFEIYNEVPDEDAFYGADVMNILKRLSTSLSQGKPFVASDLTGSYFSNYHISPYIGNSTNAELNNSMSYFSNTTISLLKFEGGKFVPIY